MTRKKFLLAAILVAFAVLAGGCVKITSGPATTNGYLGVFKSDTAGSTWKLAGTLLNNQGKVVTLGTVTINKILLDPNDNKAIYLATESGLIYSYDAGSGWQLNDFFASHKISSITDVAVDYFNKCNIFVTTGNKIYKSSDCGRTFDVVYVDTTRTGLVITAVVTEHYNNNVVYAANNKGDILKSDDSGLHWRLLKSIKDMVTQLVADKDDTRIVYAVSAKNGIYKTTDAGATWSDDQEVVIDNNKVKDPINKALSAFPDGKVSKFFIQDLSQQNTFILAAKYGLLKTTDGGMSWTEIPLVTPERGANIYSLAIDPKNSAVIYYGTDTTLYKSIDAGTTWSTMKSPTSGYINCLLIDPVDSKIIYLGGKAIPKK